MAEAALIINVGQLEQTHSNGAAGTFTVPPPPPGEEFGLLVVYPIKEIQDIGGNDTKTRDIPAHALAEAIVGIKSQADKQRWGLLVCAADPDLPKALVKAIEAEASFLNDHIPATRYKKDKASGAVVAENLYEEGEREIREQLSRAVIRERDKFHDECRRMVKREEVQQAKRNMIGEYSRLVAQGDQFWQRPTEQKNISDLHRNACVALGQERPWCYVPKQLVACPGCGGMIKENIIKCEHCNAILDRELSEYATMSRADRARLLYPDQALEMETRPDPKPKK